MEGEILQALQDDFGKSAFEAYATEMGILYSDIREARKKLRKWSQPRRVSTNLFNLPGRSYILPEPYGVCLVIGAWNYPVQLALAPVIAAMAAGNTVVLKPSELPANTSKVLARLVSTYFSPEYLAVVEGGVETTTLLLEQKFDKIFFTGSVPVGRIVYQAAARHLTPVTLELGGKSPAIVLPDANLEVSARRIAWGKFLNAGQTCIAPDYVLVHRNIAKVFTQKLIAAIEKTKYHPDHQNYVQIINDRNLQRLAQLLDPEKIIYGGHFDPTQRFFEPTLMAEIGFDDKVMEDEIFGPILPIIVYDELEQALEQIQTMPKPLACYVFSAHKALARQIMKQLSFGGGAINEVIMHITNPALPFGGVGNSGMGNYHGYAGFKTFSHEKSILEKPFWGEPLLKYPPYTTWKTKWLKRLLG